MASFIKSFVCLTSQAALLLLLVALMVQTQSGAQRRSCSSELSNLNVCAPFVVPGNNGNPSSECCGALQSVEHDCLCSTLRIASQLPSRCNIPSASCDTD
ncbi:protein MEN-8 [Ziziphus jujuba]|uniref:Protein MEN-8 n=1 Tax=Ziziphus jujuba TaxID=326968 RepID=A0A6P3ZFF8_ZIZJJ|nr:protein MEN-8 [Ziziphus jujuba]